MKKTKLNLPYLTLIYQNLTSQNLTVIEKTLEIITPTQKELFIQFMKKYIKENRNLKSISEILAAFYNMVLLKELYKLFNKFMSKWFNLSMLFILFMKLNKYTKLILLNIFSYKYNLYK